MSIQILILGFKWLIGWAMPRLVSLRGLIQNFRQAFPPLWYWSPALRGIYPGASKGMSLITSFRLISLAQKVLTTTSNCSEDKRHWEILKVQEKSLCSFSLATSLQSNRKLFLSTCPSDKHSIKFGCLKPKSSCPKSLARNSKTIRQLSKLMLLFLS